jgi:hypothetical protein
MPSLLVAPPKLDMISPWDGDVIVIEAPVQRPMDTSDPWTGSVREEPAAAPAMEIEKADPWTGETQPETQL